MSTARVLAAVKGLGEDCRLLFQMHHYGGDGVAWVEHLTAGYILKVESHAVRYPVASHGGAHARARSEERPGRVVDVNLNP